MGKLLSPLSQRHNRHVKVSLTAERTRLLLSYVPANVWNMDSLPTEEIQNSFFSAELLKSKEKKGHQITAVDMKNPVFSLQTS